MELTTTYILLLIFTFSGLIISSLIWFILLFANRRYSLKAHKASFIFGTAFTACIAYCFVFDPNYDIVTNLISVLILVCMAFVIALPSIIINAIVKHSVKKKDAKLAEELKEMFNPNLNYTPDASAAPLQKKSDIILDTPKSDVVLNGQTVTSQPPKESVKRIEPAIPDTIYRDLRHRESMGAKFLFNVNPSTDSNFPAIDVLMIDPYGIFAIEAENYSCLILGSVHAMDWELYVDFKKTDIPPEQIVNPVLANNYNIDMLRSKINLGNIPVYNLVVVPDDCELHGDISKNTSVIKMSNLKDTVQTLCSTNSLCMMSSDIKEMQQKISPYSQQVSSQL